MDATSGTVHSETPPAALARVLGGPVDRFRRRQRAAALVMGIVGMTALAVSVVPTVSSALAGGGRGASPLDALRYGGAFLAAASLVSLTVIALAASKRRKVLACVADTPGEVVWVFQEEVLIEWYRPDVARTHVHLADGTHAWFQTKSAVGEDVLGLFYALFPGISIGYSAPLKKRFRSDPASLKAKPDRSGEPFTSRLHYSTRAHGT